MAPTKVLAYAECLVGLPDNLDQFSHSQEWVLFYGDGP